MKLFVFTTRTAYGEFVCGVVHNSAETAFNLKVKGGKSLKDLGWEIKDLLYSVEVCNAEIGVAFEGGGDLG